MLLFRGSTGMITREQGAGTPHSQRSKKVIPLFILTVWLTPTVIISKVLPYSLELWTALQRVDFYSYNSSVVSIFCGSSKHHFYHNARILNTMKSRTKFSSKFFLMRHDALFNCVTRDTYLQLENQMPFPPKCPGSHCTWWTMDTSSDALGFIKQIVEQVKAVDQ